MQCGVVGYYKAMGIILASNSPRRRELLSTLGLEFSARSSVALDESAVLADTKGDLDQRLERLAQLKGTEVSKESPNDIVISADTVVVLGGEVFGKPADVEDARKMLGRLGGQTHQVFTAVCVQRAVDGMLHLGTNKTKVTFRSLSQDTINLYIDREQPFGMAGSYAIQRLGVLLVSKIEGDYANVVGLPLGLTAELLAKFGINVL